VLPNFFPLNEYVEKMKEIAAAGPQKSYRNEILPKMPSYTPLIITPAKEVLTLVHDNGLFALYICPGTSVQNMAHWVSLLSAAHSLSQTRPCAGFAPGCGKPAERQSNKAASLPPWAHMRIMHPACCCCPCAVSPILLPGSCLPPSSVIFPSRLDSAYSSA